MPKYAKIWPKIFFSKNAGNALKHAHNRFGRKKIFFQPKSIDNTVISDTYKKKKKKKKNERKFAPYQPSGNVLRRLRVWSTKASDSLTFCWARKSRFEPATKWHNAKNRVTFFDLFWPFSGPGNAKNGIFDPTLPLGRSNGRKIGHFGEF
jgi:hypothetical protein